MAKQSFIPSARDGYAVWLPILRGGDVEIFKEFARKLESEEEAEELLLELVDGIVRASLGDINPNEYQSWLAPFLSKKPSKTDMEDEILNWQRATLLKLASPMRVRVSLVEPKASMKAPSWGVRCLVSPDGGKFSDVWDALEKSEGDDKEALFSIIARLSRLSPTIAEVWKTKNKISGAGSLEKFISDDVPSICEAGVEFVRPWWNDEKTCENARVKVRVQADVSGENFTSSGKNKFVFTPMLGGEELSHDDLKKFLANPIAIVGGKYALLSRGEIANALKFSQDETPELGVRDAIRMSLDKKFEVAASGWLGEILARFDEQTTIETLSTPENFAGELRPYQARGFAWMSFMIAHGLGACLADDMGLGKTIQTLALILEINKRKSSVPTLIVCPTSLMENWRKEAGKFAPSLRVHIHHGSERAKNENLIEKLPFFDLIITSYALASRDNFLRGVSWNGIVLDESQNIKNPETAQSRAVRELSSAWRVALSGTPVENSIGDVWSQMEFLNPGLLGTWGEYVREYVKEFRKTRNAAILDDLKRVTSPFILRRLKTDKNIISDLPDKIETKQFCELTDEQIKLYEAVTGDMGELENAQGIKRKGIVLSMLLRLKQICCHPKLYLESVGKSGDSTLEWRSGKLERLGEIARAVVENGEKMLIFSQFAGMAEMIKNYISETLGEECLVMHGGVARKERDALVEKFQNDPRARFFALTMKTGGVGLNLTGASQVVLFDRWWNPAVEQQAVDRAFRIGQTRNVQVHSFVCSKTLEEWIDDLIESKKSVAGRVVADGEEWLLNLSVAELKEILRYRGRE